MILVGWSASTPEYKRRDWLNRNRTSPLSLVGERIVINGRQFFSIGFGDVIVATLNKDGPACFWLWTWDGQDMACHGKPIVEDILHHHKWGGTWVRGYYKTWVNGVGSQLLMSRLAGLRQWNYCDEAVYRQRLYKMVSPCTRRAWK